MSRGQPPKYRPEYAELLADHAAQGLPIGAFGQTIGVARRTVFQWLKTRPDFAAALKPEGPQSPPVLAQAPRPPAEVFSIAAWGVPKPRPDDGLPRYTQPTEDDVDERLWEGVAA